MPAENSAKTAPGRPFQPGQSGNPGGRPKGIAALAREHTDKAAQVLVAEAIHDRAQLKSHKRPSINRHMRSLAAYGTGTWP
jgi:hypothetical protein